MNSPLRRRAVLRGVAATALLLATAACQSAVDAQSGGAGSTPKQGGVAEVGVNVDLVPGNVLTNSNVSITTVVGLVYEPLIRYGKDDLKPQPALATEWTAAPDGTSLTLELRRGVKFHTGRPFTSEDVKFSLQTYADPKWNGQLRSTATAITAIETPSPTEVTLRLAHPVSNLFDLLDTAPILDSETAADIGTGKRFVGTGPFKFDQWRPNTDLTFSRNPDYWGGPAHLDGVHVRVIPDGQSLLSALKSGQVQLARGVGYRDAESVANTPGVTVKPLDRGAELQAYVGINVSVPGLDDPRVRQAIGFALDRERIIKKVFRGAGYPTSLPWPKGSPAFDAARNGHFTHDPAKAQALLAEHGQPVPIVPLTYVGTDNVAASVAQIVQNDLSRVGITVELRPVDSTQFVKQLIGAQFPGLWTTTHSWAQFTPSTLAVSAYPFNARRNASHFTADTYTAAADEAWQVPVGGDTPAAYAELSKQLLDGSFLTEIGVVFEQLVLRDALHDVDYTRRRELDLGKAYLS
ncbi:Oligopeptide ABC transporter, periplasmic oligopeptide-binding protein OppA [Actinokineospora spheciospongiae]|uniref:Oligopeptide ABC transporter, periplasmic oligopeptide-binding protein OppA n=1 Tax=Actinokineospora spheciospongiae TaxID=909613 RepID=W7J2V3_9PSEU|nr:Oligopeptide ABC transporter, periplasmic oligopeptide-binding protein OppA [Actinokineospora spheciospongiae]